MPKHLQNEVAGMVHALHHLGQAATLRPKEFLLNENASRSEVLLPRVFSLSKRKT